YDILKFNKINRGSPQILTTESKIIVDENEFTVDVQKRVQGLSEGIIEEFMLIANEAAATLGKEAKLPFVYRIHEYPSEEKISTLKELLEKLGLNSKEIKPKLKPKVMANLIEKTRGSDLFPIINMQVLRSMAKARYEPKPIGHYGLVIKNYTHFTSPIRRYSDLTVHRILTDFISHKDSAEILQKRYGKFVVSSSKQATETEKRAMMIERDATDCYKAEYMKNHIGEEFDGIITSIIARGMFITLPNTIEGYVKVESLDGYYEYDGYTKLKNLQSGHNYSIGQKIKVVCVASDVNSGKIEFAVE
ncbi:MAG: RNB domain-containing ribonuclease, partial [Oscillospiraceae bacterium]|nr:RNB domain-containing ribonuclease [Oscillospiraceae bacterium]